MPKVFACGDMRRGQSLVVWAIREGRQCARAVDEFLMGSTTCRADFCRRDLRATVSYFSLLTTQPGQHDGIGERTVMANYKKNDKKNLGPRSLAVTDASAPYEQVTGKFIARMRDLQVNSRRLSGTDADRPAMRRFGGGFRAAGSALESDLVAGQRFGWSTRLARQMVAGGRA